jgi:hypothetical protein
MICERCAKAADHRAGRAEHCGDSGCTCQHRDPVRPSVPILMGYGVLPLPDDAIIKPLNPRPPVMSYLPGDEDRPGSFGGAR